ncbi:MAG: hypothetical protein GF331_10190 [Chitinivibrionales bacterium]|nr:hypothetical protein [Chitinivibrionales bacterium]
MKRSTCITLLVSLTTLLVSAASPRAQETLTYQHGVMPTDASYADAKAIFDMWAADELNNEGVPDPATQLKVAHLDDRSFTTNEFAGHGMICVAVFDETSDRLKKMFNFVKHFHNDDYLMQWKIERSMAVTNINSALDGIVDVISACILAEKKWPGEIVDPDEVDPLTGEKGLTWGGVARKKLEAIERVKRTIDETSPDYEAGFHAFKPHSTASDLGIDALAGTNKGFYINYYPYALFEAFSEISNDPYWRTKAKDGCYEVLNAGIDHDYKLPAWFTNWEGKAAKPNDPWGSVADRWDSGPSRTAWRVAQAYLTEGHPDALTWARRINDVYVAEGDLRNPSGLSEELGWGYSFMTGERKGTGINVYMVGAAGATAMAAGDRIGTDNCYAWLRDPQNYRTFNDGTLKRTMHAIYMAVMTGAWDVYYGDHTVGISDHSTRRAARIAGAQRSATTRTVYYNLNGRELPGGSRPAKGVLLARQPTVKEGAAIGGNRRVVVQYGQ